MPLGSRGEAESAQRPSRWQEKGAFRGRNMGGMWWLDGDGQWVVGGGATQGSCLPIREIKTNRRRLPCDCTICTISKVTHRAKQIPRHQDNRTPGQDTLSEPATNQTQPNRTDPIRWFNPGQLAVFTGVSCQFPPDPCSFLPYFLPMQYLVIVKLRDIDDEWDGESGIKLL